MNICKNCGFEFEGNFCPKCGAKFSAQRICRNCGEDVVWDFCPKCGMRYAEEGEFIQPDLSDVTLSSGAEVTGESSSFLFAEDAGRDATPVADSVPSSNDEVLKPEAYSKCVEVYRHKKLFTFSFLFMFFAFCIVYLTFSYNYDPNFYIGLAYTHHTGALFFLIMIVIVIIVYARQLAGAKRYGIKNLEKAYYARSTTLFLVFDIIVFLFCLACTILPFYRMTNPEHIYNDLVNGTNVAYGIVFIVCDLLFLASIAYGFYVKKLTHKLRLVLFGSEDFKASIFVVGRDELSRDRYLIYNRVTGVTGKDRSFAVKTREHLASILLILFTVVIAIVGMFFSFNSYRVWRISGFGDSLNYNYWRLYRYLGYEDEYVRKDGADYYYWYENEGKDGTKFVVQTNDYIFYDTEHIYSGEGDFSTTTKEVKKVSLSVNGIDVFSFDTAAGDSVVSAVDRIYYAVRYKDGSYFDSYTTDFEITDVNGETCVIEWSDPLGSYTYKIPYFVRAYIDENNILTKWCADDGTIDIPEGVIEMTDDALDGVTHINKVSIPSTLKNFVIPDGVTSINNSLFNGCEYIESVTIPDSVIYIQVSAFKGCSSLTTVTIPDSVTSIDNYVFSGCTSLTSVIIGKSVSSIDYGAFDSCSSLETIYYRGNSSDWSAISIGSSNSPLTAATRYYYSETKPEDDGNYWHYVNGEPAVWPSVSSESVSFSDMTDADALALYEAIKSLCGYEGSYTVKNTNQNTYDGFIRDDDGEYCETGFLSEYYIYSYDKESGYLAYECSSQDLWCYDDEVLEDSLWINNEYYVPMGDGILYVYTYTYDSEDDVEPEMTLICTTDSYSSYRRRIGIVTDYMGEYMYYVMDENEWMTVDDAEDFMLNYMLDSDVFDDDDLFSNITTAMQVSESDGETIYKLSVIFRYGDYNGTESDWAYMMTCDFIFFVDENDVMTGFLYFQDYNYKGLYDDEYEEGRSVYYEYYEISYEFDESYRLSDEDAAQYQYSA